MTRPKWVLWSRRTDVAAGHPAAEPRRIAMGTKPAMKIEERYRRDSIARSGGAMPYPPQDLLILARHANPTAAFRELDETNNHPNERTAP